MGVLFHRRKKRERGREPRWKGEGTKGGRGSLTFRVQRERERE